MVKIVKDTLVKVHRYDKDGIDSVLVETVKQYHYESEDEKLEHKLQMEQAGYTDSEQVRENIGTMSTPVYVWFGSYYKYEVLDAEQIPVIGV